MKLSGLAIGANCAAIFKPESGQREFNITEPPVCNVAPPSGEGTFRAFVLLASGWALSEISMKRFLVTALTLALSAPAALAATAVPLDAGKPAGVHQAQLLDGGNGMLVVAGAALVGIGIGLATASGDASQPTATTPTATTGTSP